MIRNSVLILAAMLFAGSANASLIYYDNTTPANDTGNGLDFTAGPYDGIGDSITLAQPGAGATDALAQFFNVGDAGTFDASLEFFEAGSPVGAQIGSAYTLTGIDAGANSYVNVDFQLGGLDLPTDVVFLLEVANVGDGVDPQVELYSDPTNVGSNTQDTAIFLQGATFTQQSTLPLGGNPYFQLSASVPEPSTWLLAVAGLGVALLLKRSKASA